MTIQERIDEVVTAVQDALIGSAVSDQNKDTVLNGVKELGFQWQEANAYGRAMTILMGLIEEGYSPELKTRFLHECMSMGLYDELQRKEVSGSYQTFRTISMPDFAALIDMLMVQAIDNGAGVYVPMAKPKTDDAAEADTVVVEPVSCDKETGAGDVTGTEKTASAGTQETGAKKTTGTRKTGVKKTTGTKTRKRATGAADGK